MIESTRRNSELGARGATRHRIVFVGVNVEAEAVSRLLVEAKLDAEWLSGVSELEAAEPAGAATCVVFLDLERCNSDGDGAVRLVRKAFPNAIIVALVGDLDGERAVRLLLSGVPSLGKPVGATALAELALRLAIRNAGDGPSIVSASPREGSGRLEPILERYADERGLSGQQRTILRLHLGGKNDKEIASDCSCSEATVYEHWRRMARKAGGQHKGCVLVDFHRFLDDG